jgi:hypothetical protein
MKKSVTLVAISLALGALTAYAQGWLPSGVASLANSAAPWCLCAFAFGASTPRRLAAGWYGSLTLLALVVGYYGTNELLRGYPSSGTYVAFWSLAAVLAGPLLGVGGCAVRHERGLLAAAGAGGVGGLLVAEGIHGLTVVAATTSTTYWWCEIVLGCALWAWLAATRLRSPGLKLASGAIGVLIVGLLYAVYTTVHPS